MNAEMEAETAKLNRGSDSVQRPVRLGPVLVLAKLDRAGWWYSLKKGGRLDVFFGIGRLRTKAGWAIYKIVVGPLSIGIAPINQEPVPVPNSKINKPSSFNECAE